MYNMSKAFYYIGLLFFIEFLKFCIKKMYKKIQNRKD